MFRALGKDAGKDVSADLSKSMEPFKFIPHQELAQLPIQKLSEMLVSTVEWERVSVAHGIRWRVAKFRRANPADIWDKPDAQVLARLQYVDDLERRALTVIVEAAHPGDATEQDLMRLSLIRQAREPGWFQLVESLASGRDKPDA